METCIENLYMDIGKTFLNLLISQLAAMMKDGTTKNKKLRKEKT